MQTTTKPFTTDDAKREIARLKSMPAFVQAEQEADVRAGEKRAKIIDDIEAKEREHAAGTAERVAAIVAARERLAAKRAEVYAAAADLHAAEVIEDSANYGLERARHVADMGLLDLGEREVHQLLHRLDLERRQAGALCDGFINRDDRGRVVAQGDRFPELTRHLALAESLIVEARSLLRSRMTPNQIREKCADIAQRARLGAAKNFGKEGVLVAPVES